MPDELLELMREKLSALEKALILETDAGVKFKLKYEILNLKQQLAGYESVSIPIPESKSSSDKSTSTVSQQNEIFISYAWGGESERIVNEIDQRLLETGLTVIRDKRDLGFKGDIKEFMQRIGRGRYVVVVISNKYLKSDNCMFELLEIAKNGDLYDRIFPIVLADADIYKPVKRLAYVKHWENEIQALNEAMKEVSAANLQGFRDEIDLYTKIRERIASLTDVLKNMNTLTPEMHEASNFEQLYQAIEDRRTQDR